MSLIDEASFKEDDHPRANNGQFGAGGGSSSGEKKIKGTGAGAKPQPDFRGSMAHETSGDTTQPVKNVDDLYEAARRAEKPFKDTVEAAAKQFGGTVSYTPEQYAEPGTILKSKKSAERKIASELGGDAGQLRDVLRATVSNTTVEDTRKAASAFIGEHGDNILRVKDRYANPIAGGYRDILINYRTPEGLVAEVQFNSKNMIKVKNEDAHKIYELLRELPPADATPAMVERLEQQMAEIYEKAYLADGNGSWRKEKQVQAHDAATQPGTVFRRWKLTPPEGEPFEAALVVNDAGTLEVQSNRDGSWAPESKLVMADLIAPEQELSEWDVVKVEPGTIEGPAVNDAAALYKWRVSYTEADDPGHTYTVIVKAGKDEEDARRAWGRSSNANSRYVSAERLDRTTDHRTLDRSLDIEYYTSETLGPRRERTPEGFLICYDVAAARVGEMMYAPGEVPGDLGRGPDGRIRVTRSAAEVFNKASMASLNGKPLTDDHPPVDVDPKNWKHYTRGVVVNPRRGEGEQFDFLVVDLIVYDGELISDIEAGKREVSCGYNPDYIQFLDDNDQPIPGRGEQINIRYNHLALVKAGRCGPACAVGDRKTFDSAEHTEDEVPSFFTRARQRRLARALSRL